MTSEADRFRPLVRQKIVDSLATHPPVLTPREVWMPAVPDKALAVIGMRRAGKTSLLWQWMGQRLASGTPRDGLLYFNFEDERLAGMRAEHLDLLLDEYFKLHPEWRDGRRKATFMLDEVQLVPGWETFARRLLDTERVDLFVTGSSARMLSRDIASSMRGRALEVVVLPFGFRECLRHAGLEPAAKAQARGLPKAERSALEKALRDYLAHGGFPEAQGLDARNRAALLSNYVDVVLLRDIVERHAVAQPLVMRWLVRQLLGNAAGMFSVNKFHADLRSQNIAVGKESLHAYLAHLEDAFLLFGLSVATESEQRRRVNPRKVYPIDMGFIPLFDRSGRANVGHALETAVALELLRRGAELAYVRTGDDVEVDFLARFPDREPWLVQVCANVDAPATLAREVRALEAAAVEFPRARRLLIVLDKPAVLPALSGVEVVSAVDWLLEA